MSNKNVEEIEIKIENENQELSITRWKNKPEQFEFMLTEQKEKKRILSSFCIGDKAELEKLINFLKHQVIE